MAPGFGPFDAPRSAHRMAPVAGDGLLDELVAWYQDHGRARSTPGGGCPFAPTCSAYARTALARYGPIAIVLIVDRLIVREHEAAAAYYPAVCVDHTTRLSDDVP